MGEGGSKVWGRWVMGVWGCKPRIKGIDKCKKRFGTILGIIKIIRNWLQARLTVYPPQCADQNPVNLSKNIFSALKLLHAHLQYVCNIPTMH